jgi:hypothetical protein
MISGQDFINIDYLLSKCLNQLWACHTCGEDFTRKSSAVRHSSKLHKGTSLPVSSINYLTGRLSGVYPPPLTPPSRMGRKNKTVADTNRGYFSYANDFVTNNRSDDISEPLTTTGPFKKPIAEAVRNFMDVEKIYTANKYQPLSSRYWYCQTNWVQRYL